MENSNLMFDEGRSGLQPGDLVFEEEQPHLQGELQRRKTLPSFVKKLWFIINDTTTDHLACWTHNGQGLYVPDAAAFAKTVLPQYFKHNNWQSFVRQLNLYGFRKVCDSEAPANSNNSQCHEQQQQQQQHHHHQHQRLAQEGWQFRHDCFRRDASHMLHHIVRKRGHCRQPLSDPSMSSVSAPSTSTMTNPFSAAAAAAAGNDVNDEVPARLAKIEQTMQQMEAKSATAQDCILQLRLAQTHQNETLCALLALAKGTLGKVDHLQGQCQTITTLSPHLKDKVPSLYDYTDHEFRVLPRDPNSGSISNRSSSRDAAPSVRNNSNDNDSSTSDLYDSNNSSSSNNKLPRMADTFPTLLQQPSTQHIKDKDGADEGGDTKRRRISLSHISDTFTAPSTDSRMANVKLPPLTSTKVSSSSSSSNSSSSRVDPR